MKAWKIAMKKTKKRCSLVLAATLVLISGAPSQSLKTEAAAKVTISAKKLTIQKGKSKILKIQNTNKKVSWKLSTKKYVKIKKIGKNKVKVTAKKVGLTKITAKVGKKKYTCKVTVKKATATTKATATPTPMATATPTPVPTTPVNTASATPDTKVSVKIHKSSVNEANKEKEILSHHTSFYVQQTSVEGVESNDEVYMTNKTYYNRKGKKQSYIHDNEMISYEDIDGAGNYCYVLGFPLFLGSENVRTKVSSFRRVMRELSEKEEILSCYSEDGKIYLTSKMEGESVQAAFGNHCDGKEGAYALFEAILDENSLELLENKEYLCDKTGAKEWMRTETIVYDGEQPENVTKMAEAYESHIQCKNMEKRNVTVTLGVGTTQEEQGTLQVPKDDGFRIYTDKEFSQKYDTEYYMDETCTQRYESGSDDRQSDVSLYVRLLEEDVEESDNILYADGVSSKMSNPDFWAGLCQNPDGLMATDECMNERNAEMLAGAGTNMQDLKNMKETYNGITLRNNLVTSITEDANRAKYFANGVAVDKETYFNTIKNNIANNENVTENDTIKYAVCTTRTEVKWCPTSDFIGYSATDTDNEGVNSAIGINEPMVLKAQTADGKFYWGYTENCTGWVAASDVAICDSKEEWLDAWDVEVGKKDFLVVTTDRIVTETSFYNPSISAKTLTLGTRLKLVEKDKIPQNLDGRGDWNNYIVYMPTRDTAGNYVKEMAMISEHSKVSVGYLPFTERNILKIAFECLGNRYGWGGSLDAMDCSYYVCQVYRCFGFSLPRNTNWQTLIPSFNSIAGKTDEEKTSEIKKAHVGSVLYFKGHEMLYLGRYNGRTYVISALGSVVDVGDTSVRSVFSVTINTLDVKRKDGTTWLSNLTGINSFDFPLA